MEKYEGTPEQFEKVKKAVMDKQGTKENDPQIREEKPYQPTEEEIKIKERYTELLEKRLLQKEKQRNERYGTGYDGFHSPDDYYEFLALDIAVNAWRVEGQHVEDGYEERPFFMGSDGGPIVTPRFAGTEYFCQEGEFWYRRTGPGSKVGPAIKRNMIGIKMRRPTIEEAEAILHLQMRSKYDKFLRSVIVHGSIPDAKAYYSGEELDPEDEKNLRLLHIVD